jgi:glycosyltransferase involved in cell wall biosynthesis
MKLLLLIPHKLADERHELARNGERPQADYDALAEAVRVLPGGQADILDRNSVDRIGGWLIPLMRRLCGYDMALALLGFQCCHQYDAVFPHCEGIALPLAVLLRLRSRRPRCVTTAYYLYGRRNALWYRLLKAYRGLDIILTQSREQYETGLQQKIPESKLLFLESCGYVDARFFSTETGEAVDERQICSAGLEFRDYETLVRAVAELPDVKLKFDPASPWSLHRSAVGQAQLPPNAEIVHMKLGAVRQLYAESAAVVIPLHTNTTGAGSTTLVEAMLMGKPVIITRARDKSFAGRRDLIDGEHVIMVDAGDVPGLRNAIERLMTDQELRRRIGVKARDWAKQHANREQWLEIMIGALRGAAVSGLSLQMADTSDALRESRKVFDGRVVDR